jgi:hypothetical protein
LYSAGVLFSWDKNGQLIINKDEAVLHWLDRVGDLDQLPRCGFRVGVGAIVAELHQLGPTGSRNCLIVNSIF